MTKNYLFPFVSILLMLVNGCVSKNINNDFIEYYKLESGDSILHMKCKGGVNYECWEYYLNSQLKSHVQYEEDRLMNIIDVFDTSGARLNYGDFKDGYGFVRCFDENGNIKSEGRFENGKREGKWLIYHYSGKIIDSIFYKGGIIHGGNSLQLPHNKY